MSVTEDKYVQHLDTFPCSEDGCGEPIMCAGQVRITDMGENDAGQFVFSVALLSMELVGGTCEHYELIRDKVVIQVEP